MLTILIIDDDLELCRLLERFLLKNAFQVRMAHSGKEGVDLFCAKGADLVLSDFRLGDRNGLEILKEIRRHCLSVPFICMTGYSEVNCIVSLMKNGCSDYLEKPIYPEILLKKIQEALQQTPQVPCTEGRAETLAPQPSYYTSQSLAMQPVYQQMELVAPTPYSVIILGENGTGKEVIARTIHEKSDRSSQPFVAVDCGVLSPDLAASELFGHVKGSFTGAVNDRAGYFETANGGTLFLDEVGNLSMSVQIQLLRVLQERKFRKIGTAQEISTDVRLIIATNENLRIAVERGNFREDLYHRLNEFSIYLPPLRERPEDIVELAAHFLATSLKEMKKELKGFHPDFLEQLRRAPWTGNVRELRNVVRRAAIMTQEGTYITTASLPLDFKTISPVAGFADLPAEKEHVYEDSDSPAANGGNMTLKTVSSLAENDLILTALKSVNFNKKKAAEILHIDRKTLYNKLRRLGAHFV